MTRDEAGKAAILLLDAIMQISDRAEALGGARSIAGVAALNTLQTSLQKNAPRMVAIAKIFAEKAG